MSTHYARTSALAGSAVALAVMAGYAARIAIAVSSRPRGWHEAREFLGIGGRGKWKK